MNWKTKLAQQAKKTIDARGGPESLKQDAEELRNIAMGQGSAKDKLRAAAQAIKTPGAADAPDPAGDAAAPTPPPAPTPPSAATPPPAPTPSSAATPPPAGGEPQQP